MFPLHDLFTLVVISKSSNFTKIKTITHDEDDSYLIKMIANVIAFLIIQIVLDRVITYCIILSIISSAFLRGKRLLVQSRFRVSDKKKIN